MKLRSTAGAVLCWLFFSLLSPLPVAAHPIAKCEAVEALHRAVRFFREEVGYGGGYVYRVSSDLRLREGEGRTDRRTAWVQPPATPSVGQAYLSAYRLTKDPVLLEAALETATALVRAQLVSGGWYRRFEFAPTKRRGYAYRVDSPPAKLGDRINETTFDDDKSQSVVRYLMQLDKTLNFENAMINEAARYALDAFVRAQYSNGAWPQRYSTIDATKRSVTSASFPKSWSRTFPDQDYGGYYTINDNTISDLIHTMLEAWEVYGDKQYLESAKRGGDFFLLAQLPDPQPGWAQQYNDQMQPAWARRFEPPSVTGSESQEVMNTLLLLYEKTGEARYLDSVKPAIAYYRRSLLDDGRLARFYEIGSNRPLYFTQDYELTYSDADVPKHYGFKVTSQLDRIEAEFNRLKEGREREQASSTPSAEALASRARKLVDSLDERGAWLKPGKMQYHREDKKTKEVIESKLFSRNIVQLAEFIASR